MADITLGQSELDYRQVRRFWYDIYCRKRGVLREFADHAKQELDDPLLLKGDIFVARASGTVCGTVLSTYVRTCDLGFYQGFYELGRLPGYPSAVGITTKLMTADSERGGLLAFRLLKATFQKGIRDGIHFAVFDCNAGLYGFFRGMGCEEHAGWKQHPAFGLVCVMRISLTADARQRASGRPQGRLFREQPSEADVLSRIV